MNHICGGIAYSGVISITISTINDGIDLERDLSSQRGIKSKIFSKRVKCVVRGTVYQDRVKWRLIVSAYSTYNIRIYRRPYRINVHETRLLSASELLHHSPTAICLLTSYGATRCTSHCWVSSHSPQHWLHPVGLAGFIPMFSFTVSERCEHWY